MAAYEHDGALSRYIERVRSIPPLSREDEHDLAVRAAKGDAVAMDKLVEANLRFVVAVALQYRRYGLRLADLIAEGNLGLMIAAQKFDAERGTRFVTYAGYWIRALVLDLVVRSSSMVGAGSGPLRSKLFFRLRRERARVANLANDPTERNEILAARFETTPEKMEEMLRRLDARDVSLDTTIYPDSGVTMLDTLEGSEQDQESALSDSERESEIKERLANALGQLDQRERYIVEQRYMGEKEVSLAAIGRKLGVSRERARQLEARAKQKLKQRLEGLELDLVA
ncbi:sigma-70 family RNA polymerase sigma factor [Sandaracinus amylolyticus]|uniref:sigma-70 family RNA polymerase sigma factor n=1 Tax=Sandaracinus amylolyticus TaxID=927083 RepID=UPI001F02EEEB|nr:sigma-70 family RNA polymerase sigma factor [Sandaracinus amylolyticus]UJR81275.1 RNA polymerase sigma factor RpoH [Sandaracinus amylolyticus]